MTRLHSLAFGDLGAGWWGAAWGPGDEPPARLAWGQREAERTLTAAVTPAGPTEPWRVEGEEVSLEVAPAGTAVRGGAGEGDLTSLDQLCTVTGTLRLDGDERSVTCMGWRGSVDAGMELDRIDSFRQTAGWLETAEGFSLIALRPRRARGQDEDLLAAAVLETEPGPAVDDPRLSTTYDATGLPTRVGLELWFEPEDSEDGREEERFPRRAAGEAAGPGVEWEVVGFRLRAIPLRWHSRGSGGIGVYLLGQRG